MHISVRILHHFGYVCQWLQQTEPSLRDHYELQNMNANIDVQAGNSQLAAELQGGAPMPLLLHTHLVPHFERQSSLSWTLLADLHSNFSLHSWAKQGKSCESNSQALSVSISSPGCLREPTPWVNYPLWKSHLSSNPWARSFSGWCPLVFWTSLFLIGCDIYLLCMPQSVLSGFFSSWMSIPCSHWN